MRITPNSDAPVTQVTPGTFIEYNHVHGPDGRFATSGAAPGDGHGGGTPDWTKSSSHVSTHPVGTTLRISRDGDTGYSATLTRKVPNGEHWQVKSPKGHDLYTTGWRNVYEHLVSPGRVPVTSPGLYKTTRKENTRTWGGIVGPRTNQVDVTSSVMKMGPFRIR